MEIKTKYNVGDTVWTVNGGSVIKRTIKGFRIEGWQNRIVASGEEKIQTESLISYEFTESLFYGHFVREDVCFGTKEEADAQLKKEKERDKEIWDIIRKKFGKMEKKNEN